jgi:plasmid maintenance system antidote protein VapI
MTQARTVELSGEDLDLLAAQLGDVWVERLLRTPHAAVGELCKTIEELMVMDFGGHLRLAQILSRSEVAEEIGEAIHSLVPSRHRRRQVANTIVAALTSEVLIFALADRKHRRRVDGRGCICGWNGRDLLLHLIATRRDVEVVEMAAYDFINEEAVRYLHLLLRDPHWAATYWAARGRADDNIGLLFVALARLGAQVTLGDGEYRVKFSGAGSASQPPIEGTEVFFPLSVDNYDWTKPPGRLLRIWVAASGRSDGEMAQACDLPIDVYRAVLAGTVSITTEIARKLETGTNSFPANTWLMLERNYRAALVDRTNRRP